MTARSLLLDLGRTPVTAPASRCSLATRADRSRARHRRTRAPPAISGTAIEGQTLTANAGAWSGSTPISHSYQWRRCDSAGANCVDIAGATATTYALTAADVGRTIRVRETATNAYGAGSVESAATAVVKAKGGRDRGHRSKGRARMPRSRTPASNAAMATPPRPQARAPTRSPTWLPAATAARPARTATGRRPEPSRSRRARRQPPTSTSPGARRRHEHHHASRIHIRTRRSASRRSATPGRAPRWSRWCL